MYSGETQEHECTPKGHVDTWGCHSDIKDGRWSIPCFNCLGDGCETCGESGVIQFPKCPKRAVRQAIEECGQFFRLHKWMDEKSIFPVSGGLMDQTAYFVHCSEFFNAYANAYSKRKAEAEKFMNRLKKRGAKNGRQKNN